MENSNIQKKLFELSDSEYKDFQSNLIPNIPKEKVIGVRIPILRKYSGELYNNGESSSFMNSLPHEYYDENNLHALLIEKINDYEGCIEAIERFLPYIDNWATCDIISPKVLKKHKEDLFTRIVSWLESDHVYTCRFGYVCLMKYFMDDCFNSEHLYIASKVKHNNYYVKMAAAWYYATALTKQYDLALSFFKDRIIEKWIHNKAIQKSIESRSISNEKKEYLKTLRY